MRESAALRGGQGDRARGHRGEHGGLRGVPDLAPECDDERAGLAGGQVCALGSQCCRVVLHQILYLSVSPIDIILSVSFIHQALQSSHMRRDDSS